MVASSTTWTYADAATCAWWGDLWADRATLSAFAEQAVAYRLSTREELASIARAWRRWAADPDAILILHHGEVIARP